jgi:uncharacterized protein YndB with AHSA1/START domain/quercetin dioxygenase-like cupin family protein
MLDIPPLGVRVEIRERSSDLLEFDVVGRARGLITQTHLHNAQTERLEVIEGAMRLVIRGREQVLGPGQAMEVPPGTPHRQQPAGDAHGWVRVQVRPAGRTEEFLERLADLSTRGAYNRWGYPKPRAAAELVRDFGDTGRAAWPSAAVQNRLANAILHFTSREYLFVDEWDVAAPREAVFDALADARTYPQWWRPVYIDVEADGPPALGRESRQHFKGRLPYHLNVRSTITRFEPPHIVAGEANGDLSGTGVWTLTETPGGTHVRFDWRADADRPLLRVLTPVLRPAFRWNHNWAIARAIEGLEPYARARSGA